AESDGAKHFAGVNLKGRLETCVHLASEQGGVLLVLYVRRQYRELVAAKTRHELVRPQTLAYPFRHPRQQLVAGGMAETVVDELEIVKIGVKQREAFPRPRDAGEGYLHGFVERQPIWERGEAIRPRFLLGAQLQQGARFQLRRVGE